MNDQEKQLTASYAYRYSKKGNSLITQIQTQVQENIFTFKIQVKPTKRVSKILRTLILSVLRILIKTHVFWRPKFENMQVRTGYLTIKIFILLK